jgi:hypothetical protein
MTDQNQTDEFYFKMIKLIYSEIEKQIKKDEKDSKIN